MSTPQRRLAGELTFSLFLALFSLFMLYQAYTISGFESFTSAGAFPMLATFVMLVTGAMIVRDTARKQRLDGTSMGGLIRQFSTQITPTVVVLFSLAIAAYMLLLELFGFLLSSYLFLNVSMVLLGGRRIGLNLLISAVSLAGIYLVFQTAFSVVLPNGTLLQGWLK